MDTIAACGIDRIDMLVVNLYPFRETVAKPDCTFADAIENIDIGGPAMLRAAAKNHGTDAGGVTVVIDPADYSRVLAQMDQGSSTRTRCAWSWRPRSTAIPPPTTAPSPPT